MSSDQYSVTLPKTLDPLIKKLISVSTSGFLYLNQIEDQGQFYPVFMHPKT